MTGTNPTLRASVHDDLRNEASQEVLVKTSRESEASPIVSVFQDFQTITLEVNLSVKIHLKESPHWNPVLATVLLSILLLVEVEIVFNWASWVFGLFVNSRAHTRHGMPEADKNRNGSEEGKEYGGFETTANLPC